MQVCQFSASSSLQFLRRRILNIFFENLPLMSPRHPIKLSDLDKSCMQHGGLLNKHICETRFDVYETLCPQQMLVHKVGQIKNWSGECRDVIPTKLQCQAIQRALQSPNLQREIIGKK